jgi:ADP-ribose pyrophosphatase
MSVVFRGEWFVVEQTAVVMPNGREVLMEWVSRPAGVRVIARRDDGCVLITLEYRHELGRRDYRLPGGKVEGDNTPLEAAQEELRQETGFEASRWQFLGATQAFTMVRYSLHYFLAEGLTSTAPVADDEGEDIVVRWFTLPTAARMALDGRLGEDLSALQILRLADRESAPWPQHWS